MSGSDSPPPPPFDDFDALAAALLTPLRTGVTPRAPRMPSSPPAKVMRECARADRVYEELEAEGRRLHFSLDDVTGRVVVEVLDSEGTVTGTLSPSDALAVAAGAPLP